MHPLPGDLLARPVEELMTSTVLAVSPSTSLETVARLFATHHISGAPVVDARGRPVGVVSQSDLVDPDRGREPAPGSSVYYRICAGVVDELLGPPAQAPGVAADVLSPYRMAIEATQPLGEAVRQMALAEVHRILVLREGRLVGILTSMDVLRALARAVLGPGAQDVASSR